MSFVRPNTPMCYIYHSLCVYLFDLCLLRIQVYFTETPAAVAGRDPGVKALAF